MTQPNHLAPAPYAVPRNPLCQRPAGVALGEDLAAVQAARIIALDGQLASARCRIVDLEQGIHDLRGQLFRATATVGFVAVALGLPEDAPPAEILARVQRHAEVTEDRDSLLEVIESITLAVGLPTGTEQHKVLRRIEELTSCREAP